MCWGGGCPSLGRCARLPAHPAKNTAGLKPDPPPSGPAQSSRLPDAWLSPHPHALGRSPYHPQDRMQKRPQSQGGQARESQSPGPEPRPALYPLPSVNPTAPPDLPG